jgi:ribokinase
MSRNERMNDEAVNSAGDQLLVAGHLFAEAVFGRLPSAPVLGQEVWATDFSFAPGGIANQALSAHRIGAAVTLRAAVGDDAISRHCADSLAREGLDTAGLERVDGWQLPTTASLGFDGDRALVTGGSSAPLSLDHLTRDTSARVALLHWDDSGESFRRLTAAGVKVITDVGSDNVQAGPDAILPLLDGIHAFTPNADEALACTGRNSIDAALDLLGERVELVAITLAGDGVIARERSSGVVVRRPNWPLPVVDTTGAGDVFTGAVAVGVLRGWPLVELLDIALLVAGLCVSRVGGAFGAPTRTELLAWIDAAPAEVRDRAAALKPHLTAPSPHPTQQGSE